MAAAGFVLCSKGSPPVCVDNVLLLPEILENVFKFLPLSDLLMCRYVNRQWKKVSTPFIARSKKKAVRFSDIVIFEHNFMKLHGFLSIMIDASKIPVTEFVLRISHVTYQEPILKKFFKICGSSILRMNAKCMDQNSRADLLWDSFLLKMPNLEKLKLKIDTEEKERVSYFSPPDILNYCLAKLEKLVFDCEDSVMLMDILKASPKLKSVKLKSSKTFLAIANEKDTFQSKLKKVVLSNNEVFEKSSKFLKIMEARFTLTHLNLDKCTFPQEVAVGPLHKFIVSQSETLKVLIMPKLKENTAEELDNIAFHMPKMNKLQRFCLNTKWDKVFHISSWTQQCPALTCLETDTINFSRAKIDSIFPIAEDCLPHNNLVKLTIPCFCTSANFIFRLSKAFPKVNDFKIMNPIPTDVIDPLWTSWPKLKALNVQFVTDGCITSYLSSILLGIDYVTYNNLNMEKFEISDLHKFMVRPSITNLKELEYLQIEGPMLDRDAKASILKLKKLRSLAIYESHITRLCAEEIIRKLPHLKDWCFRNFVLAASYGKQPLHITNIKNKYSHY